METHSWGSSGLQVPIIGQGTWHLEDADDRGEAIEAMRRGIALGLGHIDTAEMYGDGEAERMVAEAIEGFRDAVFLVSKVSPQHATFAGTIEACEASLKRLRTDYLDCYLLHWRGSIALEETFDAFERLVERGKIRTWGVSNFDHDDLVEAHQLAEPRRIACNQVLYNLEERTIEARVLPYCERHGISIVGYSPFGSGSFPGPNTKGGRVLAEIAEAHGATPRQVALRFLTRRRSLFTIPKASKVAHAEENARAYDVKLSREELDRLDETFPVRAKSYLPML